MQQLKIETNWEIIFSEINLKLINESDYSKLRFNEEIFFSSFKASPINLAPWAEILLYLIKFQ